MKLHWSPKSPFVRKVMIVLHEAGLADRIDLVRSVAITTKPNAALMVDNPLNKIPTLVLDDGQVLIDSAVICEYLDSLADGSLIPVTNRWSVLTRQALCDGLMDLLLLWRAERERPVPSGPHITAFDTKYRATLAQFEATAGPPFGLGVSIDIADIALGCALSYLDFRFADLGWRNDYSRLAAWQTALATRPSFVATQIFDDSMTTAA